MLVLLRIVVRFGLALLLASFPSLSIAAATPLERGVHHLRVDDVRLWYRVAGVSKGTPVVFLHGGPGEGSQVFQAFGGPKLEKDWRIIYLDQRGAGRSDRPKEISKYSMSILVDDIERLRIHLGLERLTLLGHFMGTQLALEYAVKYPQHVQALILAGASPFLLRSLDLQCERLSREDPAAYLRAQEGVSASGFPRCDTRKAYSGAEAEKFRRNNLYPNPSVGDVVERLDNAEGIRNSGEAARALFNQGYLQSRFRGAREVTAPVLFIAGGKDYQAALEPQIDIAGEMQKAEFIVYPRSGHFMFVDEPGKFARDVNRFLKAQTTH